MVLVVILDENDKHEDDTDSDTDVHDDDDYDNRVQAIVCMLDAVQLFTVMILMKVNAKVGYSRRYKRFEGHE